MKKSLLTLALATARRKLKLHPEFECFPHYTFVVQGNKIIEWDTNSSGIPPLHYGYHEGKTFRLESKKKQQSVHPNCPKLHSEVAAYRAARGLLDEGPFEMINIRLNKRGQVRLSRPCPVCYQLMSELGCRKFYYSSECGFLTLE